MTRFQVATKAPGRLKEKRQDIMALLKRDFTITTDGAIATPPAGQVSLYWTEDGPRQKDETGTASDVGGGGADSGIAYVDVQLTDAQIKALPTTPIQLVAAPGANVMLELISATILVDAAAGAYTNVNALDASNALYVAYGDDDFWASQYINPTQLLTGAARRAVVVPPYTQYVDGSDPAMFAQANSATSLANKALKLVALSAAGDYTGGNAANTMSVRIRYGTVPTVAFAP